MDFNEAGLHEATLNLHMHACIFFPSVNSISWWQAAFEWVVFSANVRFSLRKMMEQFGFRVIPIHPGIAGLHKQWLWLQEHHNHWWQVLGYGYDQETKSFCHFPYKENLTRALNTTSLKYWLPSTDAIDRREKFTYAYEGWRSPHISALHWNSPGVRKERSDTFLTEHCLRDWR